MKSVKGHYLSKEIIKRVFEKRLNEVFDIKRSKNRIRKQKM